MRRSEPLARHARQEASMTDELSAVVSQGLVAYYERVGRKVHGLAEPLSTDQLWRRPFPYGNSIGHLLLHLTGNLRYYIGTQIAGTGYVRDRPREFAETDHRPKAEVLQEFDDALRMVKATLSAPVERRLAGSLRGRGRRGREGPVQHVPALRGPRRSPRRPDDLSPQAARSRCRAGALTASVPSRRPRRAVSPRGATGRGGAFPRAR